MEGDPGSAVFGNYFLGLFLCTVGKCGEPQMRTE